MIARYIAAIKMSSIIFDYFDLFLFVNNIDKLVTAEKSCLVRATPQADDDFRPGGFMIFQGEPGHNQSKEGYDQKNVHDALFRRKTLYLLKSLAFCEKGLGQYSQFLHAVFFPVGLAPPQKSVAPEKKQGSRKKTGH